MSKPLCTGLVTHSHVGRCAAIVALLSWSLLAACGGPALTPAPVDTATPRPVAASSTPGAAEVATDTAATPGPDPALGVGKATYASGECPFVPPAEVKVTCGTLTVPENRAKPGGRTITLAVAIFKSTSDHPAPDPVAYLEGGPGIYAVGAGGTFWANLLKPLLDTRDVIVFDQRGIEFSQPSLDCPEVDADGLEQLGEQQKANDGSVSEVSLAAMTKCHDRLIAEGIDLSAYNSRENAADVEDLRLALGYEQWNLFGVSYGTRLALTVMRHFPGGLRSVVLDSPMPMHPLDYTEGSRNADHALERLFMDCAASVACNSAYPDLKKVFYDTVDALNANPVRVKGQDVVLTGDDLLGITAELLTDRSMVASMPRWIYTAHKGNYLAWAVKLKEFAYYSERASDGITFSVVCGDRPAPIGNEQALAGDTGYPHLHHVFSDLTWNTLCQRWGVPPVPDAELQPVHSDVPALLLTGEYDHKTPPASGELAAKTLTRSYLFNFMGLGHSLAFSDPCPMSMVVSFVNDPLARPSSQCVAQIKGPEW